VGPVVNRFRYGLDPLCLTAIGFYCVNRWWAKPALHSAFLHGYFNDLLLIPAALPLVLWLQRKLGLRAGDGPPSFYEVAMHLVVWSLVCEALGPLLFHRGTPDWADVASYTVGAAVALAFWQRTPAPVRP
jgi:hypothetical protein